MITYKPRCHVSKVSIDDVSGCMYVCGLPLPFFFFLFSRACSKDTSQISKDQLNLHEFPRDMIVMR